jgi:hypothetical protein
MMSMLNQTAARLPRFGLQAVVSSILALAASIVTLGILFGPTLVGWSKALLVAWREGRWDWWLVFRSFSWSNVALGYIIILYLVLTAAVTNAALGLAAGHGFRLDAVPVCEPVYMAATILITSALYLPVAYLGFMVADHTQRGLLANITESARLAGRLALSTLAVVVLMGASMVFDCTWREYGFILGHVWWVLLILPLVSLYESSRSVGEAATSV